MAKPIKWVVLFDIDGTMVRSRGVGTQAMELAARDQLSVSQIPAVPVHGRTDRAIFGELFAGLGIDYGQHADEFLTRYHRYLAQLWCQAEVELLPGIERLTGQAVANESVIPGLLTGNSSQAAQIKLSRFGLWEPFAIGGFGHAETCRNELARGVRRAAESRWSHTHQLQFIVIGDTPFDVHCARAIDAMAVAVGTGGYGLEELASENPDLLVADLSETDLTDWLR